MTKVRVGYAHLLLCVLLLACSHTTRPPNNVMPAFQILTTESPFAVGVDQRAVFDRAEVTLIDDYSPRVFQLKTPGSDKPSRIEVTAVGRMLEVKADIQANDIVRSISFKYPLSLVVEGSRLWVNPGYIHLDAARACFVSTPAPASGVGEIWIAALKGISARATGPATVVEETKRRFVYGARTGATELCTAANKRYATTWTLPSEGTHRFAYTSRLMQGKELLFEHAETVTAHGTDAVARAIDRYYEVDES